MNSVKGLLRSRDDILSHETITVGHVISLQFRLARVVSYLICCISPPITFLSCLWMVSLSERLSSHFLSDEQLLSPTLLKFASSTKL